MWSEDSNEDTDNGASQIQQYETFFAREEKSRDQKKSYGSFRSTIKALVWMIAHLVLNLENKVLRFRLSMVEAYDWPCSLPPDARFAVA